MPAGDGPLEGHEAIRRFWWPTDGSRTRVTAYRSTVDEIDGSDDLAYVRGTGDMTFIYEKDTVRTEQTSRSMMLTVVARQPDGRWLIRRRMWGNVAR
jgi:ketosteroid isomerase-like protein